MSGGYLCPFKRKCSEPCNVILNSNQTQRNDLQAEAVTHFGCLTPVELKSSSETITLETFAYT